MRAFFALAFAVVTLLGGFVGSAEAACWVPVWRFVWGVETSITAISDGSQCRMVFRRAFKTSEVQSISISTPPRNGAASAGGNTVTYNPRAGFKGEDSFVFAIAGRRNGNAERATVRVGVTVR